MALTFTDDEYARIHHADRGLKLYNRAKELETKASQPDLSAQSYDGMPSSDSPGNYQERQVVNKTDEAYCFYAYRKRIIQTLNDVTKSESKLWYELITRRYFKHQTPTKIAMDLHMSPSYYNQRINQALLHFDDSCNLDLTIFDK